MSRTVGETPCMDADTMLKLRQLAGLCGIQDRYTDNDAVVREASPDALLAVLRAYGLPLGSPADADGLLRTIERDRWRCIVEPVVVAWGGRGNLLLRVPATTIGRIDLEVTTEQGEVVRARHALADLEQQTKVTLERDGTYNAFTVPLPGRERGLPPGYHRLEVELSDGSTAQALLISAPRRVFVPDGPRTWGIFAPLYALHSSRSFGIGDLTDLREVIEWVEQRGGSVVGTLPLLASFLDEPCEPSPYAPVSRLAWNELFVDLRGLPEFGRSREAQRLAESSGVQAAALRSTPLVDYRRIYDAKQAVLASCARELWTGDGERRAALEAFAKQRPELVAYARFRAAHRKLGPSCHAWPEAARNGTLGEADVDLESFRHHLYAQFVMHEQLEGLSNAARRGGLGLYLDLPIGVNGNGFDTWRHRDLFMRDLATGAPPDALFAGGQNWAFPPLHPQRIREDGYAHFIAVIRNHLRYAGVLRIDHVMGLHRLYTIPSEQSAKEGVYVRYRAAELYAVLSLESHRSRSLLLGENLGTVPDEVTRSMNEHGVHGMHVVQYATRPDDPEQTIPAASEGEVASINTHDMPPFTAYWTGSDIDQRRGYGWIDDEDAERERRERAHLRRALTRFLRRYAPLPEEIDAATALGATLNHLGRGDARLMLVNLEDLWGETRAQNVPGTWNEHPNWQHRNRYPIETWSTLPEVVDTLARLDAARRGAASRGAVRHDVSPWRDDDVQRFADGSHEHAYRHFGAHPMVVKGCEGTYFSVWAPGAETVAVIGDFNKWDRARSPLQARGSSGIWEGFVAGVGPGAFYKFALGRAGWSEQKTDPFGSCSEVPPRTASVVCEPHHAWRDREWMEHRAAQVSLAAPLSIYEVHLGSWMRVPEQDDRMLTYRELGPKLAAHCVEMGFTHVELMPVMEHSFYGSWGYRTTGYFAPTRRYGDPQDLMAMIDELHRAGIGVILDWVPSHFPSDAHGLAYFDGTHLFEQPDRRVDWNSSRFDYGRPEVQSFLVSSAIHWLDRYHADGLRIDAVASMLYRDDSPDHHSGQGGHGGRENLQAIAFLRRLNEAIYRNFPGVQTFAEESSSWPMVSRPTYVGGLGFGYKWDLGWMHDTLRYFGRDPIHRGWHQGDLAFRMAHADGENYVLALGHEEVGPGKGSLLSKLPGSLEDKFANLRALFGTMFGQPGKKLMFMGQEFGQLRDWNPEASLDWHLLADPAHLGVKRWVADLNRLYRREPALHDFDADPRGFEWIAHNDAAHSVFAFLRVARTGPPVAVVCNFTPIPRFDYRIGVPTGGTWIELANSDALEYAGRGFGNGGSVAAEEISAHDRPWSLRLCLPPLSVLFLRPVTG